MKKIIFSFVILLFTFNLVYAEIPASPPQPEISNLKCEVNQNNLKKINKLKDNGNPFIEELELMYVEFYYTNESFEVDLKRYDLINGHRAGFITKGAFNSSTFDSLTIQGSLFNDATQHIINHSQELDSLNKQLDFLCSGFDTEDNKFDIRQYLDIKDESVCVTRKGTSNDIIEFSNIDTCGNWFINGIVKLFTFWI